MIIAQNWIRFSGPVKLSWGNKVSSHLVAVGNLNREPFRFTGQQPRRSLAGSIKDFSPFIWMAETNPDRPAFLSFFFFWYSPMKCECSIRKFACKVTKDRTGERSHHYNEHKKTETATSRIFACTTRHSTALAQGKPPGQQMWLWHAKNRLLHLFFFSHITFRTLKTEICFNPS